SYAWSNGAVTAATTVSTAGTFTVTVTGANGCVNTGNNITTLSQSPTPTNTVGTYTSGTVNHLDGTTQVYDYSGCTTIGQFTDASGGNVLGNTTMSSTVAASMLSTNVDGYKYVRRNYSVSPTSDG